ncbi:hypothetical protein [Geobacter sp. AOG2]|uniref:hypothetical protein n=1 Tax=Geobacter sp. AOG2 TaxID=1566347 RepID=UPI001CC690B2|nr:hypothetical protein [Geobacter sp. AOG2]GFE60707.1 lipoprotein [Geobacter sp. AOG2]
MKRVSKKLRLAPIVIFILIGGMMLASGCARYARNVNALYEPAATARGGSGEVYVVIPATQNTQSPDIKWVLGKVTDNDNNQIDEVFSPRSPAEIVQSAFGLELRKAGYTVIPSVTRPGGDHLVIDLTKTEIKLDQTSAIADIKAKCRVQVKMDALRNGQMIKRLQYEATSSKTDIKDRDLLAASVLQDALQSVMLQAVPDLVGLFNR